MVQGEVAPGPVRPRAVPVALAAGYPHRLARREKPADVAVNAQEARSGETDENLLPRMLVPHRSGTGAEEHLVDGHRRAGDLDDSTNADRSGKPVGGAGFVSMARSDGFVFSAISMGVLAIGLSANFGLASTIVQERAPAPLRGRISAIFGLSFFGLTPVGSLITPAVADLIGLRVALVFGGIIYAALAVLVLGVAGRTGCEKTPALVKTEPEAQAAPVV